MHRCLRGEQNWCVRGRATPPPEQFRMFSGTYAEYYYVPPGRPIFKVPDELPDEALGYVNCAMGTVTEGLSRAGCALAGDRFSSECLLLFASFCVVLPRS